MRSSVDLVEPAYRNVPEYVRSYGPEVAELCGQLGYVADAEQRMVLDDLFGVDAGDVPVCFEFAVVAPRQNLKTFCGVMAALGWLFIDDAETVVWTSHLMTSSLESMRQIVDLISSSPALRSRVAHVRLTTGRERIELKPSEACPRGQRLLFMARTSVGDKLRSMTVDKIIFDEAFALSEDILSGFIPTTSTRSRSQLLFLSSACKPDSTVLRSVVARGRDRDVSKRARLGFVEYCAPEDACVDPRCSHDVGFPGCAMDSRKFLRMANVAAGRRIPWSYIEAERQAMPPEKFGRERLGWHDKAIDVDSRVFTRAVWSALADEMSMVADPVSVGVYVRRDRRSGAIAVAGYRADGLVHVEVVPAVRGGREAWAGGVTWVVDRVNELVESWAPRTVVVDERSAAGSIVDDMRAARIDVTGIDPKSFSAACGRFHDLVMDSKVRHRGASGLAAAVTSACWKDLLDARTWDRDAPGGDISQLMAVTFALSGLPSRDAPGEESAYLHSELVFL